MGKFILGIFIIITFLSSSCSNQTNDQKSEKEQSESGITIPNYLKDYAEAYQEDPRAANLQWFKDAKYGMFIHYGLYAILEKGEWVQLQDKIPVAEYAELQDQFDAKNFDADFITDLAIEAGMKYITITSKHHDGFCLFKTEQTDFNSLNSPTGRDLIGELVEACEKKGLGLFLYYSYGVDWKHPYALPIEGGWQYNRPAYEEPQAEYKYEKKEDFKIYLDYVNAHFKELLTQYPTIAGIWFDPIRGVYESPEMFPIEESYGLIRELSPHALVSYKQGANGDEDFMAPERNAFKKVGELTERAQLVYKLNKGKHIEICNTLQPRAWGYNKSKDGLHKSAEEVVALVKEAVENGNNLLLNVGPKADGSFPEEDIKALTEAGKILKGEGIIK